MKQKIKLSNNDRLFLLKAIMLAEIDGSAYKYLIRHQDIFAAIETGKLGVLPKEYEDEMIKRDKNWPTEDDQIRLNKILQLVRTPPITSQIEKQPSEIFSLVGPLEVEIPESKEFNKLAGTNPVDALKFLENFEWDIESRIRSLTASISQGIEKIKKGEIVLGQPDSDQATTILRNEIETEALVLGKYLAMESYKGIVSKVALQFFELFASLAEKAVTLININDLEAKLLNVALELGEQEFLTQYLNIPTFSNFSDFSRVINAFEENRLLSNPYASSAKPILDKTLTFFVPEQSQYFDPLIELIEKKRLLETSMSQDFHKKIVDLYISETDSVKKTKMLQLLNKPFVSDLNKSFLINDLFVKKDYANLEEVLNNNYLLEVFTSNSGLYKQLRNFISSEADLNDPSCQTMVQEMFNNYYERFNLLEPAFIKKFTNRIKETVTNQDIVNFYVNLLASKSFLPLIQKKRISNDFAEALQILWEKAGTTYKSKITKYKNKELGVKINDRRNKRK